MYFFQVFSLTNDNQVFSLANDNEENINCSELSSSYWIVSGKGFVFNLQFIELIVIVNLRNSYR